MTSPADSILVYVAASKQMRGVSSLMAMEPVGDEPFGLSAQGLPAKAGLRRMSLRQMLDANFDTEAHFTAYGVEQEGLALMRIPRLNKEALGQARTAGYAVLCWGVVLDLDLKDLPWLRECPRGEDGKKLPWTHLNADQADQTNVEIQQASLTLTTAGLPWNVYYRTANGARFIHVFPQPMPAGAGYEAYASKVREAYMAAGLPVDPACKDWTRLFKAPGVNGARAQDWYESVEQWDDFTIPEEEDYAAKESASGSVSNFVPVAGPRPDDESARGRIEQLSDSGTWKLTNAGREAKKALVHIGIFDSLFNDVPLPTVQGNRHLSLTQAVGQVVSAVYGFPWASPELAFGLILPAARKLGEDEDFVGKAWEMTTSFWAKEEAKAQTRQHEVQAKIEKREEQNKAAQARVEDEFLQGVRDWLPATRDIPDAMAVEYVKSHKLGIAMSQRRDDYRILLSSGYYDYLSCSIEALPKRIKESGMDWLVEVERPVTDDRGETKIVPLKPRTIVEANARTFAFERTNLRHGGCFMDVDDAGRGVFNVVPFRLRDDLEPEAVPEVLEWLRSMVAPEQQDDFLRALAMLLAFNHGPTAAVSMVGAPSTGKKMVVTGLGECILPYQETCPGDVITSKFNASLLHSPIIWIDEGISKGAVDFADQFRRIVTGGALAIERKNMEIIQISGVHRIVMTANNMDTLSRLAGGKARSEDDWGALGERIAHFTILSDAAKYLAVRGGPDFTRGWIRGDDGRPSDFKVAKTLLWLFHHYLKWEDGRPKRLGKRLLYEGSGNSAEIQDMEAEAGLIPEVACAINRLLAQSGNPSAALKDDEILVLSEKIVDEAASHAKSDRNELRQALRSLYKPNQKNHPSRVNGKLGKWKRIDARRLLRILENLTQPNIVFSKLENYDPIAEAEKHVQD